MECDDFVRKNIEFIKMQIVFNVVFIFNERRVDAINIFEKNQILIRFI